jgi:single-stranded-DNA-specific exonuclease
MMTFIIDNEEGIAGLVANKIMSMYQRPVIVLKQVDDEYKGSMRACGMADFSYEVNMTGLATCEGHENAAGIFIPQKNFNRFLETMENRLADVEFEERIFADVKLNIEQINTQLIDSFKAINFISGTGFKPLTVMVNGISGYTIGDMSEGKHLKLSLGDTLLIKWNANIDINKFNNKHINVIGSLDSGYFGRSYYKQIIINDFETEEIIYE